MALTIVMMAAGMGSRYGGPKQLEPLGPNGETMMDYAIYDGLRAGFSKAVLIVRREMKEDFERSVLTRWKSKIPIEMVYQELEDIPSGFSVPEDRKKPWGTGQAVLVASPVVDGPFAVVNADDFYGAAAYQALSSFLSERNGDEMPTYSNVGFPLKETMTDAGTVNRALLRMNGDQWLEYIEEIIDIEKVGQDGRYKKNGEVRTIPGDRLVSMNMWGFTPDIFDQLDGGFRTFLEAHGSEVKSEYLLPDYVQRLINNEQARVKVLEGPGPWCGVTYPEDAHFVSNLLRELKERGDYPSNLWA